MYLNKFIAWSKEIDDCMIDEYLKNELHSYRSIATDLNNSFCTLLPY